MAYTLFCKFSSAPIFLPGHIFNIKLSVSFGTKYVIVAVPIGKKALCRVVSVMEGIGQIAGVSTFLGRKLEKSYNVGLFDVC